MSKSSRTVVQDSNSSGFASGLMFMLKAVFIGYALAVVLLFATAVFATFNSTSDSTLSIIVNVITAFCVSFCGFLSGRHFSGKGIVFGALCGTVYSIILCLSGNMASGTMNFGADALTALGIGIICGAVGGIVGINTKRQNRR